MKQVVSLAAETTVWTSCGRNAKQVKGFGLRSWGPQLLQAGASGCGRGTADQDLKGISFLFLREQECRAGMPIQVGGMGWGSPCPLHRLPGLSGGRAQTMGSDVF